MWIAIVTIVISAAVLIYIYNKLVRHKYIVDEAWSGIDVQLKLRHDLIPNLVAMVKAYASHESETLEEVTRLRQSSQSTANVDEKSGYENGISTDLKRILVLVEAYPDLKADVNFRSLQASLTRVEDHLQYARRYYNGAVRDFNIAVESFPSNLIAKLAGFHCASFFEIGYATERQVPDVKL